MSHARNASQMVTNINALIATGVYKKTTVNYAASSLFTRASWKTHLKKTVWRHETMKTYKPSRMSKYLC